MNSCIYDISKWDRKGNSYIYPGTPDKSNWYDKGLVPMNDYTADLYGWYGFTFETELHGAEEIEVRAGLLDFAEVNAEELIDYFTWKGTVYGEGMVRVWVPLHRFDLLSSMPARWRFLRSVEVDREVSGLRAVKGKTIYAGAEIMSKPAAAGETVRYEVCVANCTGEKQAVSFDMERTGYEVTVTKLPERELVLEPYEQKSVSIEVTMSERVADGGFEKQRVEVIANGGDGQLLEFYTVRHMKHPYIVCTEPEWQAVIEKAEKYAWAGNIADTYIRRAEEWEVPERAEGSKYLFETDNAHKCFNSAVAWKLTGRREFAEKSAEFLRRVCDREKGYPVKLKACHQQLVHEGEFFKSCAKAYDLIHDAGVLSDKDHEDIHYSFRIFMDFLDWALSDGGISNWSLAEIAGALYCAMTLQDREKIERFVFGTGGALAHLQAGVYDDGWWCECTIGYNQLAAGLFSEYIVALRPWGINLASWWVPAQYSNKVHFKNQAMDGLSWDIYGETKRNYRCIEDLWDSLVALANYRSVVQGVNDSAEERFEGASPVAFDSRYDIAYAIYKKPEYARIIKNGGEKTFRDLFHGVPELPDTESDVHRRSCYFHNGGLSLLRTRTEGRSDEEQFEVSLKYGSHGGAHGHYDRCALNAVSRFGKALFNPENVWYSYGTFMYKFYVQNSISHNMVTVDLKLQDPQEGSQILFHSGSLFHASAVENCAAWSNPPYGGWRVRTEEPTFEERTWAEGRYVPIPKDAPEYTKRTGFTEKVMQRRMAVLLDDCVVCFDYIEGGREHTYHCIYHLPGLKTIDNDSRQLKAHTEQLVTDPLSSAQFITDVDRYTQRGTSRLEFGFEYDEKVSAKAPWLLSPFRSGQNVPGYLKTDLYYVEDGGSELIVGCDPEYYPVSKRLFYSVTADGETIAEGKFGAWILGRDHIEADVKGKRSVQLHVRTEDGTIDHNLVKETVRTIFWGDPYFETADGGKVYLSELRYGTENIDCGNGIGVDYAGGPVKIQTKQYDRAVPGDVIDKSREGVITVDISGLDAVRFVSDIGGDYPVGDESSRRRFIALEKKGRSASFVSVLEPHMEDRMIEKAEAVKNGVRLTLADGRVQTVTVTGMDTGKPCAEVREYRNGKLLRFEAAEGVEE